LKGVGSCVPDVGAADPKKEECKPKREMSRAGEATNFIVRLKRYSSLAAFTVER
jgi:hypothetical protein